jgi:hypothetical protein
MTEQSGFTVSGMLVGVLVIVVMGAIGVFIDQYHRQGTQASTVHVRTNQPVYSA